MPAGVLLPHLSCTVRIEFDASRLFSVEQITRWRHYIAPQHFALVES